MIKFLPTTIQNMTKLNFEISSFMPLKNQMKNQMTNLHCKSAKRQESVAVRYSLASNYPSNQALTQFYNVDVRRKLPSTITTFGVP